MIFPDSSMLYGTYEVPAGIVLPAIGPATGVGTVRATGGTGRFEGARAVFTPITGSGTSTGPTSGTLTLTGTGTLTYGQYVLPQFVYGGGWYSALYFYNSKSTTQGFTISYFANDGTPLNVTGQGTTTPVTVGPNGSVRMEYPEHGRSHTGLRHRKSAPGRHRIRGVPPKRRRNSGSGSSGAAYQCSVHPGHPDL